MSGDAAASRLTRWRRMLLGGSVIVLVVGGVSLFGPKPVRSEPFVPTSPADVLEQLPDRLTGSTGPAFPNGQPILDPELAERLARQDIRDYQATSDPRYLGHAEARLSAFWDLADAPEPILVLRAKILASNHHFEQALGDLDSALARSPSDSQALFERASIQTVRGHFDEARSDCTSLAATVDPLFALGCSATIRGATGDGAAAAADLEKALASSRGLSGADAAWAASLIGELHARAGDKPRAEVWLKQALAGAPRDSYTLGILADLYLDSDRPAEAVRLLTGFERIDSLLLRLTIAEQRLKLPQAKLHAAELADRFDDARLRGSAVHRREEARFELDVKGAPERALPLALANFSVQREAWDIRLLLASALAANQPGAAREARDFCQRWHVTDPEIVRALGALELAR